MSNLHNTWPRGLGSIFLGCTLIWVTLQFFSLRYERFRPNWGGRNLLLSLFYFEVKSPGLKLVLLIRFLASAPFNPTWPRNFFIIHRFPGYAAKPKFSLRHEFKGSSRLFDHKRKKPQCFTVRVNNSATFQGTAEKKHTHILQYRGYIVLKFGMIWLNLDCSRVL